MQAWHMPKVADSTPAISFSSQRSSSGSWYGDGLLLSARSDLPLYLLTLYIWHNWLSPCWALLTFSLLLNTFLIGFYVQQFKFAALSLFYGYLMAINCYFKLPFCIFLIAGRFFIFFLSRSFIGNFVSGSFVLFGVLLWILSLP